MNLRAAEALLPCIRAGMTADARTAKAAQIAEGDGMLREKLREQAAFDARMVAAIHGIQPPASLRQSLNASTAASPKLRNHARHPAVLCAIAGTLLALGFVGWITWNRLADFPGKENVVQMVDQLQHMTGVELEPAHGAAGGLADWFYMRGFEDLKLPEDLDALPVVGTRLFKMSGHKVGQIAIDKHNAILNVFRASEFGVGSEAGNDWTIFEHGDWAVAMRYRGDICTVLAFRGTRAEMEEFVHSLKP